MGGIDMAELHALAVALGVGLLMGVERERHAAGSDASTAGVRSFALAALCGWLAGLFGLALIAVALSGTALLAGLGYWRSSRRDPGMTSELALLLCCLLGALAVSRPALAAGVGVVAALLLATKRGLHRVSRELISEAELRDGLLLAAAALVVLPLLPDRAMDPWGIFNPAAIWRLVVLIMGIGAIGHLALRALGERWGWMVAGFFSGCVSSTAATLSFAQSTRRDPALNRRAATAALAANLASLCLLAPVMAAVSPPAALAVLPVLGGAALGLGATLLVVGLGSRSSPPRSRTAEPAQRMFRLLQAIWMALVLSAVIIAAGLVNRWFGSAAALLTALVAGSVEVHSASAGLAQLHSTGGLTAGQLTRGTTLILLSSSLVKTVLALSAGSRSYALLLGIGLAAMAGSAALALWLSPLG
ncbi:MgtC/SapB family protein [Pseudomarimonas salicorniae]|uniref:DUF4010 domain-containing protein n=1 Tax=Pseudomarimonas salicorniae TaxID=2933270 RepID=A0ABT0GD16_9GAMM|nr:DUF4010 domain-containing protein [Lysobacter sp. CAU 1642]MCK7592430.1 DUF4010 domain-containing protein [Lysobacter sp. CAU 1642]